MKINKMITQKNTFDIILNFFFNYLKEMYGEVWRICMCGILWLMVLRLSEGCLCRDVCFAFKRNKYMYTKRMTALHFMIEHSV